MPCIETPRGPARRRVPGGQRGDALLEALVALVLAAVVGLGLAHAAARMANGQRQMNVQNLAVHEMREGLLRQGFGLTDLCADPALGDAISLDCENTAVTVNGVSISLDVVTAVSSTDTRLDGDSVVLSTQ